MGSASVVILAVSVVIVVAVLLPCLSGPLGRPVPLDRETGRIEDLVLMQVHTVDFRGICEN